MTTIAIWALIWLAIAGLATLVWARIGRNLKKNRPQPHRGTPEENAGAMRDARDKLAANLPVDTEQLADPAAPTSHCPCEGWHFPTSDNCRWCKCHRTAQHPAELGPETALDERVTAAVRDVLAQLRRIPNMTVGLGTPGVAEAIASAVLAEVHADETRPT